ncbi:helix-turn-helix domain-containing protein [Enterovirga sp. GCM10030262]|uniref:helix-turn-helix domain-containing protein n=1 Tax=Enterovirga sp. GCM10030262 TaxID=3273391 RepID=UPI00361595E5
MATETFPHADSEAAMMLAKALKRMQVQKKSIRDIAKELNYSQGTVLSHMANGRVPIPIDKAPEIAKAVGLSQSEFLMAVMDQRHPEVAHLLVSGVDACDDIDVGFAHELESIAGVPLERLTSDQKDIMRQLVTDARPRRRWLLHAEIPAVQLLRELLPGFTTEGLSHSQRAALIAALK